MIRGRQQPARSGAAAMRIVVSAALLGALLYLTDTRQLGQTLQTARWSFVALGLGFFCSGLLARAMRWRIVLSAGGLNPGYWAVLRATIIGLFANNFLPGATGGDLIRPLALFGRGASNKTFLYATVIFERLCGVATILILAWIAAAFIVIRRNDWTYVLTVGAAFLAVVAALFALLLINRFMPGPGGRVGRLIGSLRNGGAHLARLARSKRISLSTMGLSLYFQAAYVCMIWSFLIALGPTPPFTVVLMAVPLASLAAMVPISLNGLGVREGAMAFVLADLGIAKADATAAVLLGLLPLIIFSALGAILSGMLSQAQSSHRNDPGHE